jgi:hypothetical protein
VDSSRSSAQWRPSNTKGKKYEKIIFFDL